MENTLKKRRITFRLTDQQIQMFDLLQAKVLPEYNKSEILRTILESIYANAKSAGY